MLTKLAPRQVQSVSYNVRGFVCLCVLYLMILMVKCPQTCNNYIIETRFLHSRDLLLTTHLLLLWGILARMVLKKGWRQDVQNGKHFFILFFTAFDVFNRPSVSRAVLQTHLSLSDLIEK